ATRTPDRDSVRTAMRMNSAAALPTAQAGSVNGPVAISIPGIAASPPAHPPVAAPDNPVTILPQTRSQRYPHDCTARGNCVASGGPYVRNRSLDFTQRQGARRALSASFPRQALSGRLGGSKTPHWNSDMNDTSAGGRPPASGGPVDPSVLQDLVHANRI